MFMLWFIIILLNDSPIYIVFILIVQNIYIYETAVAVAKFQ